MTEKKQRKPGRRRRKKKIIAGTAICAVVIAGAGTAAYLRFFRKAVPEQGKIQALSAEAEIGSISDTIVGTGNLELDDAQAITVPSGVTIEEVMVESGDHVVKGDVLAAIDKNSITEAVTQLQEEIDDLDTQILE